MHVLHRFDLHRAIMATLIAAALAIVFTLAIASALNDHGPGASSAQPYSPVPASATRPAPSASPFTKSPFSALATAPVTPPWAAHSG